MTEPRSTAHLDDEALSLVLDGEEGRTAEAHVASCPSCSARLTELSAARDAVRAATVAALAPPTLDDLVSRALAATGTATGVSGDGDGNDGDRATAAPGDPVVPLARARGGRQVRTPPPAWVVSAVAALAAIVGVAALLRTGGSVADRVASGAATESEAAFDTDTDAGRAESTSGDAATATVAANDPELVAGDLGDVADAPGLSSALAAMPGLLPRSAAAGGQTQGSGAADAAAADEEASPAPAPAPAPPATTTASPVAGGGAPAAAGGAAGPPDRTRCRSEMERMGASRFGALLTTATLRWAGQPAEVLVYTLTEPTGGFTRQALVLARPGCALLADLRL